MSLRTSVQSVRSVLVTGAAGGMGRATCRELVGRGWRVIALDHNAERLEALAAELPVDFCTPVVADLADQELVARVAPLLDPTLAGLVNLAGVSVGAPLERLQDEDWALSFRVNVDAPLFLARACAPLFRQGRRGSIVNVSSPVAFIGARKPSYAASKAALTGLTMSLARELGPFGVRVNLLLPGTTITHMTEDWSAERRQEIAQQTFLRRLCTGEEVGRVIAFLLSDDASYVTGSVLDMTSGGMVGH